MGQVNYWFERSGGFGDRTALIDEYGRTISYAALTARADAFAASIGEAALVAIEARRDAAAIVAYLGCLRRGTPVLMFEGGSKSDRLLEAFRPDVIIRGEEVSPGGGDQSASHPALRLLLSTSGSTGSAKLVRLSAANLDSNARSIVEYLGIEAGDVAITTLPLYYSYGLSVINSYLAAGATIVVGEYAVTSPGFLAAVERHGVTSIAGVPTTYDLLLSSGMLDRLPPSVRSFTQAGGKMSAAQVTSLAERLRRRDGTLWVMYGQTEASPRMAYLPPALLADHPDCIGRSIPGGNLTIEDGGAPVEPGTIGELVYRGPNVMMGYASSRDDLARGQEFDALYTGDLGREVAPGIFRIEGRLARFIKPFGLRIGLDELETLAGAGVRVAGNDDRGAVVVATNATDLASARAAHQSLALPSSVIGYHLIDEIPHLGSGKIDYAGILRVTASAIPDAHATIASIEACFVEAARGDPVSDDTTYAQIGGDSLAFIETSIVVETALGGPRDDWASLSLGQLKEFAALRGSAGGGSALVSGISADIVVRAMAIIFVVLDHAVGIFDGGADLMMVLAGVGWTRFQRSRIDQHGLATTLWSTLARFVAIYYAVVLLYSLMKHKLFISHLFLHSTFLGEWGGSLNIYWFIESLIWCTVFSGLAYAASNFERIRKNPLAFTVALFAVAIALRFVGQMVLDAPAHRMRSPDQMLAYFAGGAVLVDARMRGKLAVAAILVALSALAWGMLSSHAVIMAAGSGLLIMKWRLLAPRVARWAIYLIARNSFYIYIMCIIPIYLTDEFLDARLGRFWPLHIAVSIGTGLAVGFVIERFSAPLRQRISQTLAWHRLRVLASRSS